MGCGSTRTVHGPISLSCAAIKTLVYSNLDASTNFAISHNYTSAPVYSRYRSKRSEFIRIRAHLATPVVWMLSLVLPLSAIKPNRHHRQGTLDSMAHHQSVTYSTLIALCSLTFALTLPPTLLPASNNGSTSHPWSLPTLIFNTSNDIGASLPHPVCNGALLGTNLHRSSCFQAWHSIPLSKGRREFGDRAFGSIDIPLPRRFISGMSLISHL